MMVAEQEKQLYEAILHLSTVEDCYAFFHDLCTPSELAAMVGRWQVVKLLAQGELSYREIYKRTGVSLVTISRVARFLKQESYQGYRKVLGQLFLLDEGKKDKESK